MPRGSAPRSARKPAARSVTVALGPGSTDRLAQTGRWLPSVRRSCPTTFASDRSGRAPDLGVLHRRVNGGWCACQSSQYSLLSDQFLATLAHGQLAVRRHDGRERLAAAGLLSTLYQLATVALLKLGDVDTAWLAADRGVVAAERSEHPRRGPHRLGRRRARRSRLRARPSQASALVSPACARASRTSPTRRRPRSRAVQTGF